MTILKSIEEDSKDEIGVNVEDGELKTISDLALKQSQLEEKVSEKESELKSIKQELKEIAEVQLPEALQEVGVSEFSLVDGTKVSVTPFYSARITTDNKEEAFDWFRKNGHADLIKNTVSVSFGRAEDDTASSLLEKLDSEGFHPEQKEWVEPMTLKAFIKEQVQKGQPIPFDVFNIYVGRKTKMKRTQ